LQLSFLSSAWHRQPLHQLAIPAVVLAEAQAGVELTRKQDPAKASELDTWIDNLEAYYAIVPADGAILREWARLMNGKTLNFSADAMVAATARILGSTVATRNEKDFHLLGAQIFNPFKYTKGQI
jgi:toxin FitB